MKLALIKQLAEAYKRDLDQGIVIPDSIFRLSILEWQKHFDLEEMRLGPILDQALKNKVSGHYWGGDLHSIKSSLIELANHNPDLFWEAIKDLFNEDRMIIMKANRFLHHCDIILKDIKRDNLKINTHRQSYYSASLLLSLQYPANYCLFDFEKFEHFCRVIGVNDIPVDTDLERYYKIVNAVGNILSKDEDFMTSYYSKLSTGIYLGPSLHFVYELMDYSTKIKA
ncbi:hypothetical protein [Portibacter lacus]|uniref:Uncharacterized protein n=1 Tax=Portibacter lacus TaxID=1099794 RepID=A0AA37SPM0_9BACT|nr:hypothetical protein [Portibacter lacus]GLR17152.1 hypothetical protein GCM10007940_17670 [Portibacter lacus]